MMFRPKALAPPSDPHVRSILFDGLGLAPDSLALDGATWGHETAVEVDRRHLGCLASSFLRSHRVGAPDAVRQAIHRSALAEAAGVTAVVNSAGPALDTLTAAGFSFVMVKGAALSGLYEPRTPRYMGDVDILVRAADFQSAYDCLARRGGRTYTDDARFSPAVCPSVNVTDDSGLQIDLHCAIAPWQWARGLTFDLLLRSSTPVDVSGRSVPGTNPVHSMLVTAASIVSDCGTHFEKSLPWRDAVLLMQVVEAERRVDELVDEAVATGTGWMLKMVLDALPEALLFPEVADRLASPSRVQRARIAVAHDPRIAGRQWGFMFLRWPLRRVVTFERRMFWPSRASLRSRGYTSRVAFVRELAKELRAN